MIYSGKIYGIGHAVYTISDPRAAILKAKARELAIEKGRLDEFELYSLVERLTPEVFRVFKGEKSTKVVCINVDFYSGFVYSCLEISKELYTPCLPLQEYQDGAHTASRNLHSRQKESYDLPLKMCYGKT